MGGVMTLAAALTAGMAYLVQRGDIWRGATEVVNEQARLALSRLGL